MAIFVEQPPKDFNPSTYDLYLSTLPIKNLYNGEVIETVYRRASPRYIGKDYYLTWADKTRADSKELFLNAGYSMPLQKSEFRKATVSDYAIHYLLQEKGDLGELEFLRDHPLIWDAILYEVNYDFIALLRMYQSLSNGFIFSKSKLGRYLWKAIFDNKDVQAFYSKFNLTNSETKYDARGWWIQKSEPISPNIHFVAPNEMWMRGTDNLFGDSITAPAPSSNSEEIFFVKQKSVNPIVIEKMTEIKF